MKRIRAKTLFPILAAIAALSVLFLTQSSEKSPIDVANSERSSEQKTISSQPPNTESPRLICQNAHQFICNSKTLHRDPTGTVLNDTDAEKLVRDMREQIQTNHSELSSEQIDELWVQTIYTSNRVNRLKRAYRRSQRLLIQFIDRQPASTFTDREKRHLKNRLLRVKLEVPPPAKIYADERDLLEKSEVYYQRRATGELRLRVGGAYLLATESWFNLVFTIGHELAHAIDPCELRSASPRIAIPAYDRLSSCFVKEGLVDVSRERRECRKDDQLSETFADWMALQALIPVLDNYVKEFGGSQFVSAVANSVRDLCEEPPTRETHPSAKTRIELIFAHHPKIRELLGCAALTEKSSPYCHM